MSKPRIVRFYLSKALKERAENGAHNFIGKIVQVLEEAGLNVAFSTNSLEARHASATRNEYALFHMDAPTHARALTMRRVYYYPFWQIAPSEKRWEWQVAQSNFDAALVNCKAAERFYAFWRKRLFGALTQTAERKGFVYVPLQGRLNEQRSFQTCSPLEMIEAVLKHDPSRPIIASLHPGETYSAAELRSLAELAARHERLQTMTGRMERLLAGCDYIVTQNSSAGFAGCFFAKPCVTFAKIDFHHITASVPHLGQESAFEQVLTMQPDYAGYLWWFLQQMSINAGRAEAPEQIRAALRRGGWPV